MPQPLLLSLRAMLTMALVRRPVRLRFWHQLPELQLVLMNSVKFMEMSDGMENDMLGGSTMVIEKE